MQINNNINEDSVRVTGNETAKKETSNVNDEEQQPWTPNEPDEEIPFAIIVAGPVAAFTILLFVFIAFKLHNSQLNRRAKRLHVTGYKCMAPDMDIASVARGNRSSIEAVTGTMLPAQPVRLSRGSYILNHARKPTVPSLGLPSRGSNMSAYSDQEVINQSTKRKHSIFIL